MESRKRKKKISAPGIVIVSILILIMAEAVGAIAVTGMVPTTYLAGIAIAALILVGIDFLLVQDFRKKVRFTVGAILAIVLLALAVLGNLYLFKTMNTLAKISNANTQTSQIGIYVRTDDPAQELSDAKSYVFGIMSTTDRENTDEVLAQVANEIGSDAQTKEYDGLLQMVDGLLSEDCDVIILNQAYIPVLEDMENYSDISDKIRELSIKEVETAVEEKKTENTNPDVIEMYISGIDTRGSTIINTRSDVNIIAVLNTKTKQALLISTPRDYFVPLSISNGAKDKLTHAGIYGTNVSMDTLDMLYGTDMDYYFKVNFAGFINIIDALGGITVHSDYNFSANGYSFTEGDNFLYGEAALAFARERKSFAEGDRQRGKNQMAVIKAVMNKMMSTEMLVNYSNVMASMEGSFETSVPYTKIAELVKMQLADPSSWNIVSYSVDGTGDNQIPYSMSAYAYVMNPDEATVEKAKSLIKQVCDGEVINLSE